MADYQDEIDKRLRDPTRCGVCGSTYVIQYFKTDKYEHDSSVCSECGADWIEGSMWLDNEEEEGEDYF